MSQQKQPRQDDYVIFRSGGLAHFRAGDTPPHLFVLWIIALLATVLGLVAANGAFSQGAVLHSVQPGEAASPQAAASDMPEA